MAYQTIDEDDEIIPAGAASAPVNPATGQTHEPFAEDDEILAGSSAGAQKPADVSKAPWSKYFDKQPTQEDVSAKLTDMINDPKVPTQEIRDFYTSLGGKINEHDDKVLQDRDIFMTAHHGAAPTIGVQNQGGDAPQDVGLVENRPYSFGQGVREGIQNDLSNIAGGAGWIANKFGANTDWKQAAQDYFRKANAADDTQGNGLGKLVGESIPAAPLIAGAAPIEAGASAIGLPAWAATSAGLLGSGAATGALTTHGKTTGEVAKDAGIGALVNLGLGGLGKYAENTLAGGVKPTAAAQAGREVLDAANRLSRDGVEVAPTPDMVGGSITRGARALGEAGIFSNGPIARGAENVAQGLEAARNRAAQSVLPAGGKVQPINVTADNVLNAKGGLGDYEEASADSIGKMYNDARNLAGDTQVAAPKTLARLNQIIKDRYAQPGGPGPGITALEALRDDLTPKPAVVKKSLLQKLLGRSGTEVKAADPAQYAIQQLRDTRTNFGDNFDVNQRAIRTASKQLWGPLSEDIQTGLRAAGKHDAADAFQVADKAWADRDANLNEIVNPLLGNRSSEQLGTKLINMSRNQSDELDKALALMSPKQAAHVRASIIGDLGRAPPGQQAATVDAFSPSMYARDYDALKQATSNTFSNGQLGSDLQDIARIAQGAREGGSLRNTSGTARVQEAFKQVGKIASGGAALHTLGASALGETAFGNALASPKVASALVKLGETRPVTNATLRSVSHAPKTQVAWDRLLSPNKDDNQ